MLDETALFSASLVSLVTIGETPTPSLEEMANNIKNSNDIKYKSDKPSSVESNNSNENSLHKNNIA